MPQGIAVIIAVLALVASGCAAGSPLPVGSGSSAPQGTTAPSGPTGAAPSPTGAMSVTPLCSTLERISAPAERYRDTPIYVANEMPTDEIRTWAMGKPGYEEIWIDRDHLGWITLAFSQDAEARQAELEEEFPDVGVVAVGVPRTMAELEALRRRVSEEIGPLFPVSSWASPSHGVVGIGVGVLEEERIAAIEERFAGEPICLEGIDPAEAPVAGPQPLHGDGWRLLADERDAGDPYRTGIAFDPTSYRRLWREAGLRDERPAVDFKTEVVIWFGAVYGSSCPDLRLDDVVVDRERAVLHARIVLVDPPMACTADANPRAYLVALERARLPSGPFAIQLDGSGPPAGAPEERTLVEADLSRPGAVADPGEVHGDPSLPEPWALEPGSFIEPGVEHPFRMYVHCGIEWLGHFNDIAWRTDVPDDVDFVPSEWQSAVDDGYAEVSLVLSTRPEPVIEATANGHTVTYRPTTDEPPGCR